MENYTKISAAIITFNEERNIERCILSLQGVADEIVVVDSFSKDKTIEIAEKLGAKVIQHPFEGHIQQKNYAISCCTYDWVLSLDADEALSEELRISILEVKKELPGSFAKAYSFNRRNNYCGQWIKHSGWYPDKKTRLFHKNYALWGGINPHDKIIVQEKEHTLHLKGDLLHYTYYTVEQHLVQIEKFSTIGAKAYYERGKKSNYVTAFVHAAHLFIRNYIIKFGFLDGKAGLRISFLSAKSTYLKYAKLYKLQKGEEI